MFQLNAKCIYVQVSDARLTFSTLIAGMKTLCYSIYNYGNTARPIPGQHALQVRKPSMALFLHKQRHLGHTCHMQSQQVVHIHAASAGACVAKPSAQSMFML